MSNGRLISSDDLVTANFNTVADAWALSRNIDINTSIWTKLPAIYKLIIGGTGTVSVNTRTKSGTVSYNVVTYTTTGSTIIEYPYFDDTAYEASITITGTATAEIV